MMQVIKVAPLVGAWIEIVLFAYQYNRGQVAPLVGAWIEIYFFKKKLLTVTRRSSCRSVD